MIGILFTGGTISMTIDPATGAAVPALGAQDLLEKVPGLASVAEIEAEDFSRLPGPHVTLEQMWRLARRAAAWLDRPDVDGLVITHGTDTLEETAYFLDLVLLTPKPVVLIGAMRTSSDESWDGPANLTNAVRVAAAPESGSRGVLVSMDEQILTAREARKIHTEANASFRSPEFGPIGRIDGRRVAYRRDVTLGGDELRFRDPAAEPGLRVRRIEAAVEMIPCYAGATGLFISAALEAGARGLSVEALGRGNVTPAVRAGIEAAAARHVPVVITSRCVAGAVSPRYGYAGGLQDLLALGVIPGGDLGAPKARILLAVALGLTDDPEQLRAFVDARTS